MSGNKIIAGRRADSRQQSAASRMSENNQTKKTLTSKHPSEGQFIALFVVDRRYRSESTLRGSVH